jgi:ComF family protein
MHQILNTITSFFFPPLCLHCRREGAWLCTAAQAQMDALPILKNPLAIDGVDLVICRGEYDAPIMQTIIKRVKYDFLTAPTEIFPTLLKPLPLRNIGSDTVIVPIPLHWRRRFGRGFNQSDFVARALSQNTGLTVAHLLQRYRHTTPQATLKGEKRMTNVADAFRVRNVAKLPNSVILVDDVITTGSTIRECASVLRQAGVTTITAAALAKG